MDSDLNLGNLGQGWEGADRALAELQVDLSRTVENAPTLILLWRDAEEGDWPQSEEPDSRWAFIGKASDWYFGAGGGFELPRDYATALPAIADELAAAIVDSLLGDRTYWPRCPDDAGPLDARLGVDDRYWWVCRHNDRAIAEVGHLPASQRGIGATDPAAGGSFAT